MERERLKRAIQSMVIAVICIAVYNTTKNSIEDINKKKGR